MMWSTLCTALLFTLCLTCSCSRHSIPGTIVGPESGAFQRFHTSHNQDNLLKCVKDPISENIYVGGHECLYVFEDSRLKLVSLSGSTPCPGRSSDCNITLLEEGNDGYPLFICRHNKNRESVCCYVTTDNEEENCSTLTKPINFQEPSLLVGNDLYFTLSGEQGYPSTLGLYKWSKTRYTSPQKNWGQRYVKIIADEANGKVYSFYIERSNDEDKEKPLWIPRVSQYCMGDVGGTKDHLQYQWTSMLTARLFCGDLGRGVTFTELLDVAEVKGENDTIIYGLFTNPYNISAICSYKMSDIARIFSNGTFKVWDKADQSPPSQRPGECVDNSQRLPSDLLRFMKTRPEMEEWLMQRPLLIEHRSYTHLQADRVEDQSGIPHNVLFLSLDSGKIHKVLEKDGESLITEYQPFKEKTHIHHMLLDSNETKLYVTSGSSMVKVDLSNCSMYSCQNCTSDPYCKCSSICPNDSARHVPIFSGAKGEPKDTLQLQRNNGSSLICLCPTLLCALLLLVIFES